MASDSQSGTVLKPGEDIKPQVTEEDVELILKDVYGLQGGVLKEFVAYDDKNYHCTSIKVNTNSNILCLWPDGYILKFMNSLDSKNTNLTEGQIAIMLFLHVNDVSAPVPVKNLSGQYYSVEKLPVKGIGERKEHIVRLLKFQPGITLHHAPGSFDMYFQAGRFVANLNRVLKDFHHPVYETYRSIWHLDSVTDLKAFVSAVKDANRKKMVEEIFEEFCQTVIPQLNVLERGMIHGDFNEHNILVTPSGEQNGWSVSAILDFGDCSKSYYIFEIAITICYMMFECRCHGLDAIEGSGHVLSGYKSVLKVTELEESLLKICICARFAQSVVLGLYTHSLQPENHYVLQSQEHGWPLLTQLWNTPAEEVRNIWKHVEQC